jgi:TRAP transporter TAXI family solute receptor
MDRRHFLALSATGVAAAAAPRAAFAQPRALTLGTASTGGTYFIYGGVVATLLTNKLGIPVSTQQTQGPNQNIILVSDRAVELGMTTMGIAYHAWEGTRDGWTKGKKYRDIRALFPMYDTPFHFIVLEKSGIKAVRDLAGKRVGVGPRAGTPGTYFPLIFKALGLDATFRFGQASDMANQLADGLIDCFAFAAGIPIAAYAELDASREVRYLTFTADELGRLKKAIPELSDSLIPKGTYRSLNEDHRTVGVYNFFIAHKDLPRDVAYDITRTVLENNAELVRGHAAAKETVLANWDKNTFLPFHPGAVKYYAEKGVKIPDTLRGA